MLWQLKRGELNNLISFLRRSHEVIAPVQRDILRYAVVGGNDRIVLEQPLYPAKEFFLPIREPLFSFRDSKITRAANDMRKRIIFLSRCDANALFVLDKILLDHPEDPYYKERRQKTMIFQFEPLTRPSNYFGDELDLIDFCDVKIYNIPNAFVLKPESHLGLKLLESLKLSSYYGSLKEEKFSDALQKKNIKADNSSIWEAEAKKCLSCSACTIVCPTCCCFELSDEIDFRHHNGSRIRDWSSCQQLDFTEVAGGHVFRQERSLRVKHRILHKFKYFKERYGTQMCVGCGRCITSCPTGINIHKIVKRLK